MASLDEYREINTLGGLVNVCQIDNRIQNGPQGMPPDGSQVSPKTSYSINDFSKNYNSAKYIPFTASVASNMLTTGGYAEDDIAWSTNKESFNDAISWIWGNLTNGGVGLARFDDTPDNRCVFVESHGIYKDIENNYERIGFHVNSAISSSQASSVCLSFIYQCNYDSYATDNTGELTVYGITHKNDGTQFAYHIFTSTLGVDSYGDAIYTSSLGQILNNSWPYTHAFVYDMPYIAFEFFTTTGYGGDSISVYHPSLTFDFGDEFIPIGDVENTDVESEENEEGGTSTGGGGGGGFDTSSDGSNRVTENQFAIDAVNSGFVSIYTPNQGNIQSFCNFLFSGITEDVSIVLKRLVSNPLDYVISLNMVHYTPIVGTSEEIKFCGIGSNVYAPRVTKQFQIINCGSLDIDEQFKSFMDYNGHSKLKIYCPYCGIFPIDINDVMGGSISLQYIVDNLTGSCVAQIYGTRYRDHVGSRNESYINDRLLYEFTGNVFEQIPLSAVDYRGTIQGLMQIAGGVVSVASGQSSGLGAVASGVMNIAPDIQHSGNASTSYGYMGVQTPFIFLERQIQNYPIDFQNREGLTSNIYSKLNDLIGYTEIDIESFHSEYIKCTDQERAEIINLLGGGFII